MIKSDILKWSPTIVSVEKSEEAAAFVRRWMEDRKFFKEEVTTDIASFRCEGKCGDSIAFSVIQPNGMKRVIGVVSKFEFGSQYQEALEALGSRERDKFFRDLKKDLLFIPPISIFDLEHDPKSVLFVKEISFDELSEGELNKALDQIIRANTYISLELSEKLEENMKE
jgi:hypothetical protein